MTEKSDRNGNPRAADTDLFGDELDHGRDGRGRPKIKINKENRNLVAVLRAGGMDRGDIADALGCSERTLRTYFLPELNEGVAVKRAAVIEAMFSQAVAGNVAAQKAFLARTEFADATPRTPKTVEPKAVAVGKKEAANMDAQTAHEGTEWGSILQPPLH